MVEGLLGRGALIEAVDQVGRCALHWALSEGQLPVVALLLDRGAEVEVADREGMRPLHCAALLGSLRAVTLLLDRGADPDAAQVEGLTALMLAIHMGHLEVAGLLLDRGASFEPVDKNGMPVLTRAVSYGQCDAVQLLFDRGAEAVVPEDGETLLMGAAFRGHPQVVALLLARGMDVNAARACGDTALMLVVRHCKSKEAARRIVSLLLEHPGFDPLAHDQLRSAFLISTKVKGQAFLIPLLETNIPRHLALAAACSAIYRRKPAHGRTRAGASPKEAARALTRP